MARLLITLLLVLWVSVSQSQELSLISDAGGYFATENFSLAWSLGEPMVETYTTEGIILTQGFQQTLLEPVGIPKEGLSGKATVQVYPNPTRGKVFVKVSSGKESSLQKEYPCIIYDLLGNQIAREIIPSEGTYLDFSGYVGSLYFLNIKGNLFQHTVIIQKLN